MCFHRLQGWVWVLIVGSIIVFSPGCQKDLSPLLIHPEDKYITQPITEDFSYIADPLQRWQAYGLTDYAFEQAYACFCLVRRYFKIYVVRGAISDVYDFAENRFLTETEIRNSRFRTVEQLFSLVDSLSANQSVYLSVEYDSRFGYPDVIFVDPSPLIADEEYIYLSQNLEEIIRIR